ncbi:carotenoid oxygenase family protein [Halosimplex halophilum]|uniref:carotenoid oxygenase family protein n=1 Tax=Halosimplex halophilum TaxID=2559572 RepID=UPI001AE7084C|nr:carotenoid oxygenase family protein [Halosimplex halophilum]
MSMEAGFELGFSTLDDEVADRSLAVEGSLPEWLDGALVRNGPAIFEVGGDRVAHWFDGLAMLHRFAFEGSSDAVRYTNRALRSETYRRAMATGEIAGQFATGGGYLRRVRQLLFGEPTDNCNVHVARVDDSLVAMTEVPRFRSVDPESLATVGEFAFADALTGHVNCAHVVPDPHRGETVGLLTTFGRPSEYTLYRLPDGSRSREQIATLPADDPAYVHSFALTERYVVLTEHPFVTNPASFLLPGSDSFVDNYDWEPERGTRFRVVDRDTGEVVATRTTDAWFVFHHVNAFEAGPEDAASDAATGGAAGGADALVVDLVAYPDADVVEGLYLAEAADWFESGRDGHLRRFRVPLDGRPVTSESLYEGLELPRVAPGDRTKPYRYAYAQGAAERDGNHVAKVDMRSGESRRWEESGVFVEEPVFVRAPDAERPGDEGVVLVTALNTTESRTDLLVLDGETLAERARAPLPHAVPFGFHGRYFPEW